MLLIAGSTPPRRRAIQYVLGLETYQTFRTAVLIYRVTAPAAWLFSAAAYSGAAVLLSVLYGSSRPALTEPRGRRSACKNCGN